MKGLIFSFAIYITVVDGKFIKTQISYPIE